MPTLTEFCTQLQNRLSLDASYLTTDLPASVTRYAKRLLMDYNFPKSVRVELYAHPPEDTQSYTLPSDFKKVLSVRWMDDEDPTEPTYGSALGRRETFIHPHADGISRWYWIQGTRLWTDVRVPSDAPDSNLILVYQSNSTDYNMVAAETAWMLNDLEDQLFNFSMFRLAAELNKPELAAIWAPLWAESQKSLAVFVNELEFNDMEMVQREAFGSVRERYPI